MKSPLVVAVLAVLSVAPRLFAQGNMGDTLTAEQVLCEEQLLDRLERRSASFSPSSTIFLWRSGRGGGEFGGLAIPFWRRAFDGNRFTRFEEQMPFDLRLSSALDRLDPSRPLLPQGSLVRRDSATAFPPVPPLSPAFLTFLTIDLAPGAVDPFFPILPLSLVNRPGAEFGRADRSGRGIDTDNLTEVCHDEVSELDEKIFLILSRTLRIDGCFELDCPDGSVKATMFRGREPLRYRVNLVSYGVDCPDFGPCHYGENGPIALELSFDQNAAGQLTTGTARVVPECTGALREEPPGCTSQGVTDMKIYFLPPLIPGVETQSPEVVEAAPFLIWIHSLSDDNVTETTIDWAALLANTAWNGGS